MLLRYSCPFIILITVSLVSGCGSRRDLAPVVGYEQPASTKVSYHVVAPGETLYAIAWRYNLDYKKLAKANKIGREYRIYPGQRIELKEVEAYPIKSPKVAATPNSSKKTTTKTNAEVVPVTSPNRLKNKSSLVEKRSEKTYGLTKLVWSWPARGKIIQGFNSKNGLNKGIDIKGDLRESVLAAASGTVVYSGGGLRGYGKLVIIKHSEKYLSAYAHNHRLLVKEGDQVVRNSKIAEMGKTGTDAVKLHFEIRYDGAPVDPLAYLPPR